MNDYFMIKNSISIDNGALKQFLVLPQVLYIVKGGGLLVDGESFNHIQKDFKGRQLQFPVDYEHQTLQGDQVLKRITGHGRL